MTQIRFGIWALVHGSRGAMQDPDEPYDASWERNKALILEAERLGYDSTLVAQHTINPHHAPLDQLEAWTSSAALAALTSRIEIITAIKPYLYHPVVLAKMALQIEHISRGRFAINLVNAWNMPELEKAGIGFAPHDERYAYGREWISVVEPMMRGETVRFRGEYFNVDEYTLRPADPYRARPRIYVGGESTAGEGAGRRLGRCMVHQRPTAGRRSGIDRGRVRSTPRGKATGVRTVGVRRRPGDGNRGPSRAGTPDRACCQGRADPEGAAREYRSLLSDGKDHVQDAEHRQQWWHGGGSGGQLRYGG